MFVCNVSVRATMENAIGTMLVSSSSGRGTSSKIHDTSSLGWLVTGEVSIPGHDFPNIEWTLSSVRELLVTSKI